MHARTCLPIARAGAIALLLAGGAAAGEEPPAASPAPASATAAAPRRAETPNGALAFALPEGWNARPLNSGVALEPPGNPLDETIVVACEPFVLRKAKDGEDPLAELFDRLRAGQLATIETSPRPSRATVTTAAGPAQVVTYKGTDDGGRPSALSIFAMPCEGRVAILTARVPWSRLASRWDALNGVVLSFAPVPAADEKALAKRLGGTWRSDAAPLVALRFLADGTFEETREEGKSTPVASRPSIVRKGAFDVIGREVRLRFDEGDSRAFRVDAEAPGEFTSAGQAWHRIGE
jgi:hypothetical protein